MSYAFKRSISKALSFFGARREIFIGWLYLIPRILGVVDTQYQRWEDTEAHFCKAIDIGTAEEAYPELARSYFDYAQMLLSRGELNDIQHATELAKKSLSIFTELDMEPFRKRVNDFLSQLSDCTTDRLLPELFYTVQDKT
ncbi:hypothetical protein C2W62_44680 [Candidatus Entotheonella serta]|nr:hypothetical protein C2W62_44680 [Candidatus Entotheonella serta]